MPSPSSFLRISGAQPFSSFLTKEGGSSRRRKKRTKNVSRKRISKKEKKTIKKEKSKTIKQKRNKHRPSKRKTKRRSNTRTLTLPSFTSEKQLRCKCDKKRKIKGTEPSPKGLGYCAHCTNLNVVMKGKDGKLWENKKYLRGKRWVKVQTGGFIRGENYLDLT